ncbi:DNRLRE domain-containing protein [Candidatus Woesearchaeota archaeon]|nr:DNRLRE domain-containing protein [Candidatus Woesearchaeota archaeon]
MTGRTIQQHNYRMYAVLLLAVAVMAVAVLTPPRQPQKTGFAVVQDTGNGTCECDGVRSITVMTNVTLNCSATYNLTAKIFQGGNVNPNRLIDSEDIVFTGCPQGPVDSNPGGQNGNLIIESIGAGNVTLRFHNTTLSKLRADDTFLVTIKGPQNITRGPSTKHLSCSEPIDVGETFGDFTIIALDKILKGTNCTLLAVVQTDKPIYKFGEPVNITGSNWDPTSFITCNITMPNSTVFEFNATSDIYGKFNYTYPLSFTHPEGVYTVYCIEPGNPAKNDTTTFEVKQTPIIFTDKNPYGFNETVNITGLEFIPNCSVALRIRDQFNNTAQGYPVNLPSSSNGTINTTFYANQFCPGTYVITAIDQCNPALKANTTFDIVSSVGSPALNATMDTSIKQDSATTNFGTSTTLTLDSESGKQERSLLQFNLSIIPQNATILAADLQLIQAGVAGSAFNATAYRVLNPWTELAATWNAYNGTNWTSAGGDFTQASGWRVVDSALGPKTWNISSLVVSWLNSTPNFGLIIVPVAGGGNSVKTFGSREGSAASRPRLFINFTPNFTCSFFPAFNDTTPPNITLIAPPNASVIPATGNLTNVTLVYQVFDNESDIAKCTLAIDNATAATSTTVFEGINQTFNQTLIYSHHTWTVNCTDTALNNATSDTRSFTLATQPPRVLNITALPGIINLTMSVNITANVTDDIALTSVLVNITDKTGMSWLANMTNTGGDLWVYEFTSNLSLQDGMYNATIIATDLEGNINASESTTFNITPSGLVTVIQTFPPDGFISSTGTVTFTYIVTGNVSSYNCTLFLDGLPAVNVTASNATLTNATISNILPGTHFWRVSCFYSTVNSANTTNRTFTVLPLVPVITASMDLTVTPDVAEPGENALFQADIVLGGLLAAQSNITNITISIVRIENTSAIVVLNATPMNFLTEGIWFYQYNVGDNKQGTYIATATAFTNETPAQVLRRTITYTVSGRGILSLVGISPDLINFNETVRVAAEFRLNNVPINSSLIQNATLVLTQLGQPPQTFTVTTGLSVGDGIIYLDGVFNTSGVYVLNWSATYFNASKAATEIVVVSGIEARLSRLNASLSTNITSLILQVRTTLLEVLKDLERHQEFTEEEIFLITDSVNSMTSIAESLEKGTLTEQEAQKRYDEVQEKLSAKLGSRLTGAGASQLQGSKFQPDSLPQAPSTELQPDPFKPWAQRIVLLLVALLVLIVGRATYRYLARERE